MDTIRRATVDDVDELAECRRRGTRRIELDAMPEAAPIDEAIGFVDRVGGRAMHLPPAPETD